MKLKNILSYFLLLIGLLSNILAVDEEKTYIQPNPEIHALIMEMEEKWIPTEILGFFEVKKNKAAKWNNESSDLEKVYDKIKLDQYNYLTITGKINYFYPTFGEVLKTISDLNLHNLIILDLDFYFYFQDKKKVDRVQELIEKTFENNHGLMVVFRTGPKEISRFFTIK